VTARPYSILNLVFYFHENHRVPYAGGTFLGYIFNSAINFKSYRKAVQTNSANWHVPNTKNEPKKTVKLFFRDLFFEVYRNKDTKSDLKFLNSYRLLRKAIKISIHKFGKIYSQNQFLARSLLLLGTLQLTYTARLTTVTAEWVTTGSSVRQQEIRLFLRVGFSSHELNPYCPDYAFMQSCSVTEVVQPC
jgi:hypothetical protein